MRRSAALLFLSAALAVTAGQGAGAAAKPALHVETAQPLVLRGVAFEPREVVRVTVVVNEVRTARRLLRAGSRGGFTTAFAGLYYDQCSMSLLARATGTKGSRVTLRVPVHECPNYTAAGVERRILPA